MFMKHHHVALHPGRHRSVSQLVTIYRDICVLHFMCVTRRRSKVLSHRRRAVRGNYETHCGVGGDAGSESDDEEVKRGGAPTGGSAVAETFAPGGGIA